MVQYSTGVLSVLASRFIYLLCPNSFYDKEDPDLLDNLLAERDAILLWAVHGWQRLNKQRRFTTTEQHKKLMHEGEIRMDPVGQFVLQHLEVTGDANDFMSTECLYGHFQNFTNHWGVGMFTKDGFSKTLNGKPLRIQRTTRTNGTVRGFSGLRFPTPSDTNDA